MTEQDKRAPAPPADAGKDDEDAPVSSNRPATPPADARSPSEVPPEPPAPPVECISYETLHAYLGVKANLAMLARFVRCHISYKAPKHEVEDFIHDACLKALASEARARTVEGLPPWLFTVVKSVVRDKQRAYAREAAHLDREAEVEEQQAGAADRAPVDPLEESEDMLGPWIEQQVALSARDTETLEILRYKARAGLTDQQIADERGETVDALRKRVERFKKKYAPLLRRHRDRMRVLFFWLKAAGVVAAAAVVAVIVWLLWLRPHHAQDAAVPDPDAVPRTGPAPSASPSAAPRPAPSFDQALPPPGPPAPTNKL